MYDRDPREICFQFNKRILGYFCVDHTDVWMATKLSGKDTYFLPFNQGSNGAGNDGGKGNPANPNGYPTKYLWQQVFQKDSMMDIIQKFINLQAKTRHTHKPIERPSAGFPPPYLITARRRMKAQHSAFVLLRGSIRTQARLRRLQCSGNGYGNK